MADLAVHSGGILDRRSLIKAALLMVAAPARAAEPQRVACLDYALAETMLALGKVPSALPETTDWTRWVVEPPLPASVVNLGTDREVNLELLQSLKPDLILSTPYLAEITPLLERIAPVEIYGIYEEGGASPLPRAIEVTRRLAERLEATEAGGRLIASTTGRFALDRNRLGRSADLPVLAVSFMDARHVRVYGAKSLFQDVLEALGLANAWRGETNYWGFATVGIEALADWGAATLVYLDPLPPDALPTLERSSLWRALPFVREQRLARLAPVLMFGALPSAQRFSRLLTNALDSVPFRG